MNSYSYLAQLVDTSVTAAITLVQVKAGAAGPVELLRCWCSQRNQTASAMQRIAIVRKSAAATVTSFTPLELNTSGPASAAVGSTSATGVNASAEGTDTDVLFSDAFNVLSGWVWIPTPEERIVVPSGGFIALKFTAAPGAAMNVHAGIVWQEIQ